MWHLSNETLKLRWFPWNWMQSLPVLFPCCSQFIYRVVTVLYRCFWLLDNSLRFLPSGIQWDFLSLKGLETSTKLVLLPLRWYWEELSLHFHFFWKSASDPVNGYVIPRCFEQCVVIRPKPSTNSERTSASTPSPSHPALFLCQISNSSWRLEDQGPFAWVKLSICQ